MSSAGQYQGSQAFNNINTSVTESVNPNTGSLNLSIPLAKLSGVRESVDLTINLFYSAGFRGTFGLPRNWGLDFPYVLNAKSVTTNCRTYAIDAQWTDLKNYASGLRYTNNHGIKFRPEGAPKPLPSGQSGKYGYKMENSDGSSDYFDGLGKPLEHHDIYGNFIRYAYTSGSEQVGVDNPQLRVQRIVDSWRQNIDFAYQTGSIRIRLPDGSETSIQFSEAGVHAIVDADGKKTRFDYVPFGGGPALLQKITYPSGLISKYDYGSIQYLNEKGAAGTLPAVQNARSSDSNDNVLQHTRYTYGTKSGGQTYTGASIGCRLGGSQDALMEKAVNYKYDVVTARLDQTGKVVSRTCTWYNNLHLPIETISFLITDEGNYVDANKTKFTYKSNLNERARTTSYQLPVSTETFQNNSSTTPAEWQPLIRTEASYNEYDNAISSSVWLNVPGAGYVKHQSSSSTYVTTSKNIQIPTQSWIYDHSAQTAELMESHPTADGRGIARTTSAFQRTLEPSAKPQIMKEHAIEYDTAGRPIGRTHAWRAGAEVLEGTIKSAKTTISYVFNGGVLSRTETDALGNSTVFLHDMQRTGGPLVRKTLPLGQFDTFDYDKMGRVVKHTDALGQQTTTIYSESPAGTCQLTTSPLGYCTQTSYDILGREVETSDNGDPTVPLSMQASRVLSRQKYNMAGLVEESSDKFGLATKYTFDALDRPITVTDPRGNVVSYAYQNGGSKVTQTLNGQLRSVTNFDALSRAVRATQYPDTDDRSTDYCLIEESSYNATGKVLTVSQAKTSLGGSGSSTPIQRIETKYGPGNFVESTTMAGYTERGIDTVQRSYTLDLFDNVATYTKTTTYADGRNYVTHGPVKLYNEDNQFVTYRNQEGQEEHYKYDRNGWPSKTIRFDGIEVAYTSDALGRTVKTTYPSSVTENLFDADGHVLRTQEGSDTMSYTFSLDGTQTGMMYSDRRSQTTTLDKFSRPVRDTDVFGAAKETQYNDLGLVSLRGCGDDRITYSYGSANHTENQYLSCSLAGGRQYTSSISYDGFGRLRQTAISDPAGEALLVTTYQLDARGKITSLKSESSVSAEHNSERTFLYDGIGQVIEDKNLTSGSKTAYTYDGNSNVISVLADGQQTEMTYNKIDQRVDPGFKYDTNGRLLQDNEGRAYTFDDHDRLVTVSPTSTKQTKFTYHSDNYLANSQRGDDGEDSLYYNFEGMSAVSTTISKGAAPEQTNLFSESGSLIAGYKDGAPGGYFLQQLASTALVLSAEGNTSSTYSAYGSTKTPSQQDVLSSFGFSQGYTDHASGIIYLGARFYNPNLMAFISMDTYQTENRYSYCEGDPINRMDPTGHDWIDLIASGVGFGIGLAIGALVTASTGGLAAPVAAMLAGAASGAASQLTTTFIQDVWGGKDYSTGDYIINIFTGAASGALSAGATWNAGENLMKSLLSGAALGGGMEMVKECISGKGINGWNVLKGAGIGVASAYWGRRTYIRARLG